MIQQKKNWAQSQLDDWPGKKAFPIDRFETYPCGSKIFAPKLYLNKLNMDAKQTKLKKLDFLNEFFILFQMLSKNSSERNTLYKIDVYIFQRIYYRVLLYY